MASPEIIEATDANFESEVLQSDTPVVVDFWAPWCGPCKQIAPILDQLAGEFKGRVRVAKVDVDRNRMVANAYAIQSIPTLIAVRNGEVVGRVMGFQNKNGLAKFFQTAEG